MFNLTISLVSINFSMASQLSFTTFGFSNTIVFVLLMFVAYINGKSYYLILWLCSYNGTVAANVKSIVHIICILITTQFFVVTSKHSTHFAVLGIVLGIFWNVLKNDVYWSWDIIEYVAIWYFVVVMFNNHTTTLVIYVKRVLTYLLVIWFRHYENMSWHKLTLRVNDSVLQHIYQSNCFLRTTIVLVFGILSSTTTITTRMSFRTNNSLVNMYLYVKTSTWYYFVNLICTILGYFKFILRHAVVLSLLHVSQVATAWFVKVNSYKNALYRFSTKLIFV